MRYLLFLAAIALFSKTAVAGLGWTLDECKEHYGEPIQSTAHALGIAEYVFSVRDFFIDVDIDQKGKVGLIIYHKSSLDEDVITQLLEQNAPKATWSPDKLHSAWRGSENGSAKYVAMLVQNFPQPMGTTRDSLLISTYEFNVLNEASKKQEAKEQASGL
jgi:hypothetical protein